MECGVRPMCPVPSRCAAFVFVAFIASAGAGVYADGGVSGGVGGSPEMATQATSTARAERAGSFSREDFARLFQEHARLFWCIAAGVLGDRSRAGDVVQEAAVVGLTRLEQFEPGTSFQAWMGQIVRFVALNEARKMKPAATPNDVMAGVAGRGGVGSSSPGVDRFSGDIQREQEAFDDDVARALRGLDETARACLLMKTVLELPYARIGEALGIPEGTAMSHVHRSRAAMRAALTGRGGAADGAVKGGAR